MSTNHLSHPPRRNYASLGDYYEPDGPPIVHIQDDEHGVLVRTSPYGHHGPQLCMSLDLWHELKTAVSQALDERSASRYADRLSGAVGL